MTGNELVAYLYKCDYRLRGDSGCATDITQVRYFVAYDSLFILVDTKSGTSSDPVHLCWMNMDLNMDDKADIHFGS